MLDDYDISVRLAEGSSVPLQELQPTLTGEEKSCSCQLVDVHEACAGKALSQPEGIGQVVQVLRPKLMGAGEYAAQPQNLQVPTLKQARSDPWAPLRLRAASKQSHGRFVLTWVECD